MKRFFQALTCAFIICCSALFSGNFAYVSNSGDGTLIKINLTANTVVGAPITGFTTPQGLAVSVDGRFVYVSDRSGFLHIVSTATDSIVKSIPLPTSGGFGPIGVAMSPDGTTAYVANEGTEDVHIINTSSQTLTSSIPNVGDAPQGFSPGFYEVYRNNERIATIPSEGKTSFKDHNLKRKQTYTYVIAADGSGESGASDSITVKTPS